MFGRNKIAMLVAEFLGTGFLTLVVLGVQRSSLGLPYFIAIAAGVTVTFATYAFAVASGAHFNPALTLALWTARRIRTVNALLYIVVQLLGAWAAYGLYHYFVNSNVQEIHNTFSARVMLAEAVGTLVLAMGWAAASYNAWRVNRFATVAGLSFAVAIVVASAASVGLVNPALALGTRAWAFWGANGWGNYVLGPVVGALVGVNLYGLLFAPEAALVSPFRVGTRGAGAAVAEEKVARTSSAAKPKAVKAKSTAKATTRKKR